MIWNNSPRQMQNTTPPKALPGAWPRPACTSSVPWFLEPRGNTRTEAVDTSPNTAGWWVEISWLEMKFTAKFTATFDFEISRFLHLRGHHPCELRWPVLAFVLVVDSVDAAKADWHHTASPATVVLSAWPGLLPSCPAKSYNIQYIYHNIHIQDCTIVNTGMSFKTCDDISLCASASILSGQICKWVAGQAGHTLNRQNRRRNVRACNTAPVAHFGQPKKYRDVSPSGSSLISIQKFLEVLIGFATKLR